LRARKRATGAEPSLNGRPVAPRPARHLHVLFGTRDTIAGAVYGTVIAMATITAESKTSLSAWLLLLTEAATVTTLWVAHVYAASLQMSIRTERRLHLPEIAHVAYEERAIVLAGVLPGIALALGGLKVCKTSTAIWLALGAGLLVLAVQGVRYARIERMGFTGTALAIGVNLALGLAIVLLKAAVMH
jgi:hypothetical protein